MLCYLVCATVGRTTPLKVLRKSLRAPLFSAGVYTTLSASLVFCSHSHCFLVVVQVTQPVDACTCWWPLMDLADGVHWVYLLLWIQQVYWSLKRISSWEIFTGNLSVCTIYFFSLLFGNIFASIPIGRYLYNPSTQTDTKKAFVTTWPIK